jgi:bla regulator protein blaR1
MTNSLNALAPVLIRHLADPALRAIALACVAALALAVLRVRSAGVRLAVWKGVLYAAVTMPVLAWVLPAVPLRLPDLAARLLTPLADATRLFEARPVNPAPSQQTANATLSIRALTARAARISSSQASDRTVVPLATVPAPELKITAVTSTAPTASGRVRTALSTIEGFQLLVLAIYFLGLAFLAGRLTVGFVLGRRLRRNASRIDDQRALRWAGWHSLAMGVNRAPELAESPAVSVPLTLGVVRPLILLPSSWTEWDAGKLSAVIAHEVSHVKRLDSLQRALALAYRSAFWFSPLAWWLERRLADLAEQASDEAAILAGAEPTYYAEVLMSFMNILQSGNGRVHWQGVSMARGARVRGRIDRVLSSTTRFSGRMRGSLLALILLVAAPVVVLAAAARPQLPPPAAPPSAPATAQSPAETPPPAPASAPKAAPAPAALSAKPIAGPILPAPPGTPRVPALAGTPAAAPIPPASPAPPPKGGIGGRIASTLPPAPAQPPCPTPPSAPAPVVGIAARMANTPHPAPPQAVAPSAAYVYAGAPVQPPPPAPAAVASGTWSYAQTPSADYEADDDRTIYSSGDKEGMDFAFVSGDSQTVNSSWGWAENIEALRRKIGGDCIWFRHDGNSYVIHDAATIRAAKELYAPEEELGRMQEALGKKQEVLGRQQEKLGRQQEAVRVMIPSDLADRLQKVEAEIRHLGPTASREDLGRLQGELGDIEGEIGGIQGKAGDAQEKLGEQQGELGATQGELGRKQGELGREQGRLAREAALKMQALLKQALANGTAQRAPE